MTRLAPVVAPPDTPPELISSEKPDLYVSFAAGRRGAGSVDCLTCGTPVHQHVDMSEPGYSFDPTLPWYDGSGDSRGFHDGALHEHQPAHEIGPTFGPFTYTENTYAMLRVDDGETLAHWDSDRGDWVLSDMAGEYAGQAYSDITVYSAREGGTAT